MKGTLPITERRETSLSPERGNARLKRLCQQALLLFRYFTTPSPDPSVSLILQNVLSLCLKGKKAAYLSHFLFKRIIVFIYFWLCWISIAAWIFLWLR